MSKIKEMSKHKAAPSILSTDLHICGQVVADGDIQIDGTVEGNIRSAFVTIGKSAKITGELAGDDITIKGRVTGVIRGKRVHLCAGCHVEADIFHEALAIENGSHFNGSSYREENPLAKASVQLSEAQEAQNGWTDENAKRTEVTLKEISGKKPTPQKQSIAS